MISGGRKAHNNRQYCNPISQNQSADKIDKSQTQQNDTTAHNGSQ